MRKFYITLMTILLVLTMTVSAGATDYAEPMTEAPTEAAETPAEAVETMTEEVATEAPTEAERANQGVHYLRNQRVASPRSGAGVRRRKPQRHRVDRGGGHFPFVLHRKLQNLENSNNFQTWQISY